MNKTIIKEKIVEAIENVFEETNEDSTLVIKKVGNNKYEVYTQNCMAIAYKPIVHKIEEEDTREPDSFYPLCFY